MMTTKPLGSLSLDLDNHWSYLKIHGNPEWRSFPSYLEVAVPRILQLLESEGLRITFFIVGQDAALSQHRSVLRAIAEAGHEIGNHSFHHESWLHTYSPNEIRSELETAEQAIFNATGLRTRGFRGPGFSLSTSVLQVLSEMGYDYDASTWPTFIGPLARSYYMRTKQFTDEERAERSVLFGTLSDGIRPLNAYQWGPPAAGLIEVPVSTFPLFRIPIHLSYMLYLRGFSPTLARLYMRMAFHAFRLARKSPSFLLHTLDFLGAEDVKGLEFFPAMNVESQVKVEFAREVLRTYKSLFEVVTVSEHAEATRAASPRIVRPNFTRPAATDRAPMEEALCEQKPS